jgi:hypothetical protein
MRRSTKPLRKLSLVLKVEHKKYSKTVTARILLSGWSPVHCHWTMVYLQRRFTSAATKFCRCFKVWQRFDASHYHSTTDVNKWIYSLLAFRGVVPKSKCITRTFQWRGASNLFDNSQASSNHKIRCSRRRKEKRSSSHHNVFARKIKTITILKHWFYGPVNYSRISVFLFLQGILEPNSREERGMIVCLSRHSLSLLGALFNNNQN